MRSDDPLVVQRLRRDALASGGGTIRAPGGIVLWDRAGRCERPVLVEMTGYPMVDRETGPRHTQMADVWVRCRMCETCLRDRRREWVARCRLELALAGRSWFVTYTLRPEEHYKAVLAANVGKKYTEEYLFKRRCAVTGKEFTRYFKRVRKESGAALRYCLVTEAHESGLPHWHALIHERGGTVTYRNISDQWTLGFSVAKLVKDEKAAWYVAKYLGKSALARVRASKRYGDALPVGEQSMSS